MRQKRRSYREPDDDEDAIGEDLAAVNERLDALTRQLERMAQANARRRAPRLPRGRRTSRADRVCRMRWRGSTAGSIRSSMKSRAAASEVSSSAARYAPPPPPPPPQQFAPPPPQQFAPPPPPPPEPRTCQLGGTDFRAPARARWRTCRRGQPAPQHAAAPANWGAGCGPVRPGAAAPPHQHADFVAASALRERARRVARRSRRDRPGVDRGDAAPGDRGARNRSARLGRAGRPHPAGRRRWRGARHRSNASSPRCATRCAALRRPKTWPASRRRCAACRTRSTRSPPSGQAPQGDPMAFKQLEQAVVSLRGVVSNVASDGALAQLAAEVRGLGAQFERATADSSTEALAKLEARIAALMESGRAVPPELEGSIRALSERLDRMQLSQGDQLALGALEDRIAKLSEKLDASDSRLGHLEAIERGLADLLVYLEEMRSGGARAACARRRPSLRPRRPRRRARLPKRPRPHRSPVPAMAQSPLDLIPELPPHHAPAAAVRCPCRSRHRMPPPPAPAAFAPPPPAPHAAPNPQRGRPHGRCRAARSASRSIPICRPIRRSSPAAAPRASSPARPQPASPPPRPRSAMPGRWPRKPAASRPPSPPRAMPPRRPISIRR